MYGSDGCRQHDRADGPQNDLGDSELACVEGRAALGYVPGVTDPEPAFTVAEHVRERLALLGGKRRDVDLHGLDPHEVGRELSPYGKVVLGLVLAEMEEPAVIALDGVDDGLNAAEQTELWRMLAATAERGAVIIVAARELDPERATTLIDLGAKGAGVR